MSVLLLLISALVLIYLGIGGTTAAAVLVIATVVGLFQDGWHILSILSVSYTHLTLPTKA